MDTALSSSRSNSKNPHSYSGYNQGSSGRGSFRGRGHSSSRGGGGVGGGPYRQPGRALTGRGGYHGNQNHPRSHAPYSHPSNSSYSSYRMNRGTHFTSSNPKTNYSSSSTSSTPRTQSVDPQLAMMKQLTAMIAQMGDFIACSKQIQDLPGIMKQENNSGEVGREEQRPVVRSIAKNIQDLVSLLCTVDNAPLFLTYCSPQNDDDLRTLQTPKELAGPLATIIASCVATMPLHTPSYVALTLGIEEYAPSLDEMTENNLTTKMTNADEETRNIDDMNTSTSQEIVEDKQDGQEPEEEQKQKQTMKDYKGFAQRCIHYTCHAFFSDLDQCFSTLSSLNSSSSSSSSSFPIVDAFQRCKLLLRYLALMSRIGIVVGYKEDQDLRAIESFSKFISTQQPDSLQHSLQFPYPEDGEKFTLAGLLIQFTIAAAIASLLTPLSASSEASSSSTTHKMKNASILLTTLVLSTIPYVIHSLPKSIIHAILDLMDMYLFHPQTQGSPRKVSAPSSIQDVVLQKYQSTFTPGKGSRAFLLAQEQKDDPLETENIEDEEEEEVDEEEIDEDTPICADTLQDLFRTARAMMNASSTSIMTDKLNTKNRTDRTRFTLLSDAPWLCLSPKMNTASYSMEDEKDAQITSTLTYSGKPLYLTIPESCYVITHLLHLGNDFFQQSRQADLSSMILHCHGVDGIVFGRLNLFDNLADNQEESCNEEHENKQGCDEGDEKNSYMDAYIRTFSSIDRYFLHEAVREVLICHRPRLTSAGFEKGSCKDVAEQLWAVSQLFSPSRDSDATNDIDLLLSGTKGVEYGIVEVLLSLIFQCQSLETDPSSPIGHIFISRVVLELIKYQPARIPQSLAIAVAIVFEDVIPTLVPQARTNFSKWFAFHLNNTDYQWPSNYWNHWAPYAVKSLTASTQQDMKGYVTRTRNSKGEFVTHVIHHLSELISSPEVILTECISGEQTLIDQLHSSYTVENRSHTSYSVSESIDEAESGLVSRIWKDNEDPDTVRDYLLGDTVSESINLHFEESQHLSLNFDRVWWRTGLIIRSILQPVKKHQKNLASVISRYSSRGSTEDVELHVDDNDILTEVIDTLSRFKSVISATLAYDLHKYEEALFSRGEPRNEECDLMVHGHVYLLGEAKHALSKADTFFDSFLDHLLKLSLVTEMSVLRWLLGDVDGSRDGGFPVPFWWDIATSTVRMGITHVLTADENISMMMESVADANKMSSDDAIYIRRMKVVTDFVQGLLKYASDRVVSSLQAMETLSQKQPSPDAVDLREGLKYFISNSITVTISALKSDKVVAIECDKNGLPVDVEGWIMRSGLHMYTSLVA